MNEHRADKVVELNAEEAKQVTGGATGIEYNLIAAGIGSVIIAAVTTLGQKVSSTFNSVQTKLK